MVLKTPQIVTGLYLVATPIGTASDISLRALEVLKKADLLVAEDTRTLRKLMLIHDIPVGKRAIFSYNDHNGFRQRSKVLNVLKKNKSVAFVSDAGTPLISDPGFRLVEDTISEGYSVHAVPGASSVISALIVSGLPLDRFCFGGFIPTKKSAKTTFLSLYKTADKTCVFFERTSRLNGTLTIMEELYGAERRVAICRELTKKFEEVRRGTLASVKSYFRNLKIKGELVIVLGPTDVSEHTESEIITELRNAMRKLTFRDAVTHVTDCMGIPRQRVYRLALALKQDT
ncbi:MAG: 16S rRNA (cytidine(1402)-2'-O)-methyltransferase [Pseudomonadota bacterium]|nr:16S rRNA (cytidine(1402)-2'-O)-methyltransferase [Pseudomonadota bacterium]